MTAEERLVRQLYASFNARDIDATLSTLAEDVAWENGQHGGHLVGHSAVRAYWTAQWRELDPNVEPMRVELRNDGSIAVEVRQVVHDLAGQLLLDEQVRHVFNVAAGCVTRFDIEKAGGLAAVSAH